MDLVKARRKAKKKKDKDVEAPESDAAVSDPEESAIAGEEEPPAPTKKASGSAVKKPSADKAPGSKKPKKKTKSSVSEPKAGETDEAEKAGRPKPEINAAGEKEETPKAKEGGGGDDEGRGGDGNNGDDEGKAASWLDEDDLLYAFPSEETYIQSYGRQVDAEETLKFISFKLSSENYAIDMMSIQEIIRLRDITEVPRTPPYISGIISLRGVIVPVFDLRLRLSLDADELTRESRILITKEEGEVVAGLLVDKVMEVVKIYDADIEPPPVVMKGVEAEYLKGIGRSANRIFILLNLGSIVKLN